jgi:hypothetical protein
VLPGNAADWVVVHLSQVAEVTLSTSMLISGYIGLDDFRVAIAAVTRGGATTISSFQQTVSASVTLTIGNDVFDRNMTAQFKGGLCAALEAGDNGGCFGVGCVFFGECMSTVDYPEMTREACANGGAWYDTTNVSDCATIGSVAISDRLDGTRRQLQAQYAVTIPFDVTSDSDIYASVFSNATTFLNTLISAVNGAGSAIETLDPARITLLEVTVMEVIAFDVGVQTLDDDYYVSALSNRTSDALADADIVRSAMVAASGNDIGEIIIDPVITVVVRPPEPEPEPEPEPIVIVPHYNAPCPEGYEVGTPNSVLGQVCVPSTRYLGLVLLILFCCGGCGGFWRWYLMYSERQGRKIAVEVLDRAQVRFV